VSVTVSYPGVYIQELPSSTHTVTPAPTSVTVFIGYTNPYWKLPPNGDSPPWGQAVEVFSFADYEAAFGGLFSSPFLPDYVGQAVFQFFENGGSHGYVIALPPATSFFKPIDPPAVSTAFDQPTAAIVKSSNGFNFTALQPVGVDGYSDPGLKMTASFSNFIQTNNPDDTADLTLVYGTSVETYRRVLITDLVDTVNATSRLARVEVEGTPTKFSNLAPNPQEFTYTTATPAEDSYLIDITKFADVFAADAPLDKVPIFNLMLLPGITDNAVLAQALAYCEAKRAFFIMDPPADAVADDEVTNLPGGPSPGTPIHDIVTGGNAPPVSANGALYFPYLRMTDPVTGGTAMSPPSGFVAGIFAREDVNRGVWKSPAGLETTILGSPGVVPWGALTDPRQGVLNTGTPAVNALRTFPGIGTVVFGGRTLVSENPAYEQWWYVAVRRMALFIEQSLYSSLRWAIHEPNDTPLWNALRQEVQAFMLGLFRQGAFQGPADKAFAVQCDDTTTTQSDIDQGIVNIIVSFAPLKPAEFVVVKIAQLAGQS
jgi:Bacteriophage tail sheath protein